MEGQTDEWMGELVGGRMDGQQAYGWACGSCIDRWMEGKMDR